MAERTARAVEDLQLRCDTLLVLLGEKEEELQASLADTDEVRALYQRQIEELMLKVAPPRRATP